MTSKATTSVRGAPYCRRAEVRTRGGVHTWIQWMRLAPTILGVLIAVTVTVVAPKTILAQDDVSADVLAFVESQFGGYGLRRASAVVLSPDDKDVYVASEQDDAVVHFTRDAATGDLTYKATYVNGENNVTGLVAPVALAVDSDGKNLYVTGRARDAVVVFARDPSNGVLTWLETEVNDAGGVKNMVAPDAVSVSPDGANVYVAGDLALTVFARAGDGSLDFVQSEEGAGGGVSFALRSVIVSPDNANVYVTSHLENTVAVLDRDTGDMGKVTIAQTVVDGAGGVTGLSHVQKLAVSADGANIYATGTLSSTGYMSGTVVVFNRAGDGTLSFVETHVDGVGANGIDGARSIQTSADGKNVYVAGVSSNSLAVFNRNGDGTLAFASCFTSLSTGSSCTLDTPGLEAPSGIAISADGSNLYITAEGSDSLSIFARDAGSGALTFADVLYNSDGGVLGLGGADGVAVSPDGKNVYVAGRADDAVVAFQRDAASAGGLTFVEAQRDGDGPVTGLLEPSSVTVSPDGKNVYATGYLSGTVVVFARNDVTGTLAYVETKMQGQGGVNGLNGAWSTVMSPDGLNLYATGIQDGTLVVFARDAATGSLTQIQAFASGVGGVTGILGAAGIAISPDGANIYVAGSDEDSVALFDRDSTTGELTFVESYAGLPGLDGAVSVTISSDGMNVYVASVVDGTITVFQRDATSGALAKMASAAGLEEDASGDDADASVLTLYWAVDVSPDDKYVYAVGWELSVSDFALSGIVSVFARDAGTGLISKAQTLRNDEGAIRGLREPTSLAVSADSKNVYVTSVRDSATLVFEATGSAQYEDIQYLPLLR